MSLYDKPKQTNLQDDYPEGKQFILRTAWVQGVVTTQYGDRTLAKVIVGPVDNPTHCKEYGVFGSLAEQVESMEPSDIPTVGQVTKDGNRWLFSKVRDITPEERQALGLTTPQQTALPV